MNEIPEYIKEKINKYFKIQSFNKDVSIVKVIKPFYCKNKSKIQLLFNIEKINNIRRVNKFHESINSKLSNQGIYVCCAETLEERRERMAKKVPFGFKNIIRIIDFMYKRIIPKLPILKKVYFSITKGRNRVISKAEILGRLLSCGFEILEYFEYNNLLYVISKKNREPDFNMKASYGFLFKMKRVGFKGQIIEVYKIRTMYPYSEYCQNLIIKENKLAESGKILDDFRITTWGKIFRKFWIDELPMFVNFFKRDLNLVGVRPLSENYFFKYPRYLQELRIKVKPGLIPPYYSDLPKNFEEILKSEEKYLEKKLKSPIITDIKYFFKAMINILFKRVRSS